MAPAHSRLSSSGAKKDVGSSNVLCKAILEDGTKLAVALSAGTFAAGHVLKLPDGKVKAIVVRGLGIPVEEGKDFKKSLRFYLSGPLDDDCNDPLSDMLKDTYKTYKTKQLATDRSNDKLKQEVEMMVGIKITPFKRFKRAPVTLQVKEITDKDFQYGAYNNFAFEGKLAVLEVENHILRCAL